LGSHGIGSPFCPCPSSEGWWECPQMGSPSLQSPQTHEPAQHKQVWAFGVHHRWQIFSLSQLKSLTSLSGGISQLAPQSHAPLPRETPASPASHGCPWKTVLWHKTPQVTPSGDASLILFTCTDAHNTKTRKFSERSSQVCRPISCK